MKNRTLMGVDLLVKQICMGMVLFGKNVGNLDS